MNADPIAAARGLVADLYPDARWALLAGSVLTAARTSGSDLDIVILLPDAHPRTPCRESHRYDGWPAELLVHDDATLRTYLSRDGRRPTLHRMVATGMPLLGDPSRWQREAAAELAAGPAELDPEERDRLRYHLTDLLDDLIHARDAGEGTVITAATWTLCAEFALAMHNHWTGTGKWLLRELRDLDADLADRWLAAAGDQGAVATLAEDLLAAHGGPLFAGYHATGRR
ncbi:MAG TPA: nucleotidyltransferase domain-containing protein [Micromonosporaceae bacterium]